MIAPVDNLCPVKQALTAAVIIDRVAAHYRVRGLDLTGCSRARCYARPRQIAMWLAHRTTRLSLPQLGRALGGRDHSTVLHGIRRVDQLRAQHPGLKRETDALLAALESERAS